MNDNNFLKILGASLLVVVITIITAPLRGGLPAHTSLFSLRSRQSAVISLQTATSTTAHLSLDFGDVPARAFEGAVTPGMTLAQVFAVAAQAGQFNFTITPEPQTHSVSLSVAGHTDGISSKHWTVTVNGQPLATSTLMSALAHNGDQISAQFK